MALRLGDGVERLPGIGPARARSLEKLGLATVEDLLRYFPRDYEDRRRFSTVAAAPVDTPVCLELLVAEPPHLSRIRKGLELVKARAPELMIDGEMHGDAALVESIRNVRRLRPGGGPAGAASDDQPGV